MALSKFQTQNTFKRWQDREDSRAHNLDLIQQHRFFDIDSPQRIQKFLSRRGLSKEWEELIREDIKTPTTANINLKRFLNLERILGTNDLVPIYFLQDALRISKTVGRIWLCDQAGALKGYGNGFMVSASLLLTNHHVLPDTETASYSKIEFNYQLIDEHTLSSSELFQLNPDAFFYTFEELDFTLIAVKPLSTNAASLQDFGCNHLSMEEGKTIISQWLNIIQHPAGMPKQVGLRGNQLIDILDHFIHYKTDTAPGSSGSPVYNERWEVVALHHSGVWQEDRDGNILALNGHKWNSNMGEDQIKWKANEGVRISSILKHLQKQSFSEQQLKLVQEMLNPIIAISPIDNAVDNFITSSLQSPAEILSAAKIEFSKWKEVLGVRFGYVFKDGWITNERAIVVTVKKRKTIYELEKEGSAPLPDYFMNYPVEVTGPTVEELIVSHFGQDKLESLIYSQPVSREEIKYLPPPDVTLKTISKKMNVIAHISPEEGWANLKKFISDTQQSLTIGIYDFGAPHILEAIHLLAKKSTFEALTLAIQPGESVGEGTKANDLKDKDVVESLKKKFNEKFHSAWIPVGSVNGWVASSYHIKVAISDHRAFWLSSGNWQSSNQPPLEKLNDISPVHLLRTYNREWHVIVENEELASTYERFILNDYEHNKNYTVRTEELLEDLNFLIPVNAFESFENKVFESFKPFSENRLFTVTPLLTPDNFHEEALSLINSAESELLIQNQTFNAPQPNQKKLEQLIAAVLQKQHDGVTVKIIFRIINSASARKNLEKLIEMGFDKDLIKLQRNCHNKGIIVDQKKILLGSQNWSNDGISVNRDASLIFHDEDLAIYFRNIFLHDWNNLARYNIGKEAYSIALYKGEKSIPKGMERMTWSEIRESVDL